MLTRALFISALTMLLPVAGPGQTIPTHGISLSGNIYLRTRGGTTHTGTALQVKLYAQPGIGALSQQATICSMLARRVGAREKEWQLASGSIDGVLRPELLNRTESIADSVLSDEENAIAQVSARLFTTPLAISETGLLGKYAFDGLPHGRYILLAKWEIGEVTYWWELPVTIAHEPVSLDLNNNNVSSDTRLSIRCPQYRRPKLPER